MKWICVEERLPTDYTTYLVCDEESGTVWFMDYYSYGWESCDSDGETKIRGSEITHWMPFPKPPEVKDNE